jgi:hypothetical protein
VIWNKKQCISRIASDRFGLGKTRGAEKNQWGEDDDDDDFGMG